MKHISFKNLRLSLANKIFIALVTGCLCGIFFNILPQNHFLDDIFVNGFLNLIGQAFTNLIKSMVVPLVFVSISLGVASIGNLKKLGSVGSKIILFYLGTTMLAVTLAILFSGFVNPDANFHIPSVQNDVSNLDTKSISVSKILLDIIPTNPFKSLVDGNMLQIIFFAVLLGFGIVLTSQSSAPIKNFLTSANEINLKLISAIMNLAPFGVFALITYTFSNFGLDIIASISRYLFVVYFVLFFHASVVYSLMFKFWTNLNLKTFWKKFWPVATVAFSTASSNAALPVSINATDNMGVSRNISSFTLSLGSTINMNGTAIMHGITVVFLAHVYNINLSFVDLAKVIIVSTLASVGTAGVPGVGMLMLAMVLELVNIPVEGIGIVLGIDRILDAGRTLVNVMGDCVCTLIVAVMENEFDKNKFDSE